MKRLLHPLVPLFLAAAPWLAQAQTGPFDPDAWPPTIDANKVVHYVVTDGTLTSPGGSWAEGLQILSGGDQGTEDTNIGGHTGKKVIGTYLNIADAEYAAWAESDMIDILVQVYGNDAVLSGAGAPRNFQFLTGTLPNTNLNFPIGGQIPVEGKNGRWNWVLFRIANAIRPDGQRFVGTLAADAAGATAAGGVNGGTIRFEGVGNLIVRVVAFGQEGAFGTPEDINKFLPPETCDPEPNTNLAGIDINANTADHVQVLNDGDQTVTYQDGIGPANDKRRAAGLIHLELEGKPAARMG